MLSTLFSFNYGRNHIMKKRFSSIISLLVAATMLLTALVSCGDNNEKKTPSASDYIEKIFDKAHTNFEGWTMKEYKEKGIYR